MYFLLISTHRPLSCSTAHDPREGTSLRIEGEDVRSSTTTATTHRRLKRKRMRNCQIPPVAEKVRIVEPSSITVAGDATLASKKKKKANKKKRGKARATATTTTDRSSAAKMMWTVEDM